MYQNDRYTARIFSLLQFSDSENFLKTRSSSMHTKSIQVSLNRCHFENQFNISKYRSKGLQLIFFAHFKLVACFGLTNAIAELLFLIISEIWFLLYVVDDVMFAHKNIIELIIYIDARLLLTKKNKQRHISICYVLRQ